MIPLEDSLPSGFADAIAANYRIERKIGQGGMAMVFLATDLRHSRPVAIKVLHPMIASAIGRRRFLREIDTVARLSHPNILPLHDSGDANGVLYYVMPFVEGQSLRDLLLNERALSVPTALRIASEIATALEYAHEHGVIHRDIKPENILLQSGHAIVSDFGIALAESGKHTEHLTTEPSNLGTPAYASPEQITGTHQIGSQSDVYSLAVVLHEMLTSVRPPKIERVDGRNKRVTMSTLRKGIDAEKLPPWLDDAVERALEPDPSRRFQDVKQFGEALQGRTHARKNSGRNLLTTVAVLALVALSGWWFSRETQPAVIGVAEHRIVVMPFVNRTSNKANDQFGLLAADWITSGLQKTGVVDVVPSLTALQVSHELFRSSDSTSVLDANLVSAATNAGIVVTGTISDDGDTLVINAQVTDVQAVKLLASIDPIQIGASDRRNAIALINSRVMSVLAEKFNKDIGIAIATRGQPPLYDAYVEFATGLDFYSVNRSTDAEQHFLAAYTRDSAFTSALLMASVARSNTQDYVGADSLLRKVEPHRDQLSKYDQLWLDYRRNVVTGKRPDALANVRELARMAPGSYATYNLAVEAMQNGYLNEARDALLSLSPVNGPMARFAPYWDILTRVYHSLGDQRRERVAASRAFAQYPDRPYVANVLARSLAADGKESALLKLLDSVRTMPPDPTRLTQNAIAMDAAVELRAHNHPEAAQRLLNQLLSRLDSLTDSAKSLPANRFLRARGLYELGQWRGAQQIADSLVAAAKVAGLDQLELAGAAAWRAGDTTAARALLSRLDLMPKQLTAGNASFAVARLQSAMDDGANAIVALQHAIAEGKAYGLWTHTERDFGNILNAAGFQRLVQPKP